MLSRSAKTIPAQVSYLNTAICAISTFSAIKMFGSHHCPSFGKRLQNDVGIQSLPIIAIFTILCTHTVPVHHNVELFPIHLYLIYVQTNKVFTSTV